MSELWARVTYNNRPWSARVEGDAVDLFDGQWLDERNRLKASKRVGISEVSWLAPVTPHTILCVGRNYQAHAAELHHQVPAKPLFFLKQFGSLAAHQSVVRRPTWVGRVDYEGELVLVIGKLVRHVGTSQEARSAILGLTIGNDITARDLQDQDGQWTRAKGFDTFAPVGPWVLLDQETAGRQVSTTVNGAIRQDGNTHDFIFPAERLIMEASRFMTLYPGDLIFTGTPAGVGPVNDGDTVEVTIEGIGTLSNLIKNED